MIFNSFTFCKIICSPIGNVCAGIILKEYDECLPPCEGIYADVTKIAADNVVNGKYYEALLMDYNRYKRFNYPSESMLVFFTCTISFVMKNNSRISNTL